MTPVRLCLVYMNMFVRFDEIPAMTLQDIKETKHYEWTDAWVHTQTDNVKTVYPPQTKFAGGINSVDQGLKVIKLLHE